MRRHTHLSERRYVLLDAGTLRVDALGADTLLEFDRVVDPLTAGEHLLPADEHIEGICDANAVSYRSSSIVDLGVEGPRRLGELIDDVEVCLVLGTDDLAKGLLLRGAHVFVVAYVGELRGTFLSKELLRLGKGQTDFLARLGKEERFRMVNGSDCFDFGRTSLCIDGKSS